MLRIRDLLSAGAECENSAVMALTCAGVAVQRRIALGVDGSIGSEDQLRTTMALLFVLVVMGGAPPEAWETSETGAEPMQEDDGGGDHMHINSYEDASLAADLRTADDDTATNSWAAVLRTPGTVCQVILSKTQKAGKSMSIDKVASMATLFFRSSAQAIQVSMLDTAGVVCDGKAFLTLDTLNFVAQANEMTHEKLQSLADAAESEAGQQILRDLILSFKLPRKVVGVRRTCLLSRDANKVATEKHSETLGAAHDAAMHGARWTWDKDADPVHKMCALLAGVAVMLCKNAQSIRKDDMFYGRVTMPFLETFAPEPGTMRLALLDKEAHLRLLDQLLLGAAKLVSRR